MVVRGCNLSSNSEFKFLCMVLLGAELRCLERPLTYLFNWSAVLNGKWYKQADQSDPSLKYPDEFKARQSEGAIKNNSPAENKPYYSSNGEALVSGQ